MKSKLQFVLEISLFVILMFIVIVSTALGSVVNRVTSASFGSQIGSVTYGAVSSATYTISINLNGLPSSSSSTVDLAGTALPAGATGAFTSGSLTVSGGNTVALPGGVTSGTITLTITNLVTTPVGTTTGITLLFSNLSNATTTISGTYTVSAALPVELTSFTATETSALSTLHWQTATEVNNYGFDIEKAVFSKRSSDISWKKVGFVEGVGNSNSPKEYSFTDKNISSGKYSYRLKQIDRDGKFIYSSEVEVTVAVPKLFALAQNYPNPFNPTTTISYQLPANSFTTLKVYDALGKEVATLVNEMKEAGSYDVQLSTNNYQLSSGVYFYKMTTGKFSAVKKLILLK